VAWGVLTCGSRPPRSRFVKIPLDLRDANGLAVLSMITSVTPGTVWSELALDRSILLLHVFDLDDDAQFIEHFKQAYERPLMEIFE
jgi:multicomponent K+:H+ antiporter subunit E